MKNGVLIPLTPFLSESGTGLRKGDAKLQSEKGSGQRSVFSYQRAGDGEIASSYFPFGKDFLAKTFTETALRRAQGER